MLRITFKKIALLSLIISINFSSVADEKQLTQDPAVRKFANETSVKYNIDTAYLYSLINKAKFNAEVIEKMKHPYETQSWLEYKKHFITPERIQEGIIFWDKHRKILAAAEEKYGIPPDIIVAIIGMETRYGKEQGHYQEMDTLTTLAFYYPPKAQFFQKELGSFIKLSQEDNFDPFSVEGSYAGAIGIPQFMPSSYLFYGVTYSGAKKADLFENKSDAIMSVANFLMQSGWERDEPIAIEAKLKGDKYKTMIKTDPQKPSPPQLSLVNLATYGIYSDDSNESRINSYWKANLMKFSGEKPEFLLGLNNFYVLTLYNNSDQYAFTAYLLGKELQKTYREYLDSKAKNLKTEEKNNKKAG